MSHGRIIVDAEKERDMKNWDDLTVRRAYLIKMGFSKNKVNAETDAWVLKMTNQY